MRRSIKSTTSLYVEHDGKTYVLQWRRNRNRGEQPKLFLNGPRGVDREIDVAMLLTLPVSVAVERTQGGSYENPSQDRPQQSTE